MQATMEPLVHVVTGKQGRTNANKPSHELLALHKNIAMDSDYLFDFQIEDIVTKVKELTATHHGHRFDQSYMVHHDGAYGVRAIMIDNEYNVHTYTVPIFRPTSHGGHVVFRTGKEIESVLKVTHSDVPVEEAGGMELGLFVGKFKDLNCLLIVPDTLESFGLFRALNLETKGDGSDTTTLVYLRLCDKLGLGRSPPHLSIGKFKFLFPGVALDSSQVKSKKRPLPPPVVEEDDEDDKIWNAVHEMLENSFRKTVGTVREGDFYRSKSFLFGLAKRFLALFNHKMGPDVFDAAFTPFTNLNEDAVLDTIGSKEVIKSVVNMHVDDAVMRETMWNVLNSFSYKKTGQPGGF